jgi:glucoamylase
MNAPGWPGIPPRWTSSSKTGVGTALSQVSRVWFTLSHGIVNEVYYPRVDQAAIRDLGLIVTDGREFFSEEKRHTRSEVTYLAEGVPAYRVVNTCARGSYRIEKDILTDPARDVVLQWTRIVPMRGTLEDYHLYVLLAPHLDNRGAGNTAWIGEAKGARLLLAHGRQNALALASSVPWLGASAGYVGVSDGWQDLSRHRALTWAYDRAEDGNVALVGEVDLGAGGGEFVLALGFGHTAAEAGHTARASLLDGFDASRDAYIQEWESWQSSLDPPDGAGGEARHLSRTSAALVKVHEAKAVPGGVIASLSIPWGFAKGDDDLGGYHLVWPRDLVEAAGGLLAVGARDDARRLLRYLYLTQESDGHWPQNMWLDGTPYWTGVQMDETALPILLVDLARREDALPRHELARLWPMVRRAAGFIVRNGPVTPQDRWEEDPGYSPFTLAAEVSALRTAADLADAADERSLAGYLRETGDAWDAAIERWTYLTGTDIARQVGVDGYYVRIAPPDLAEAGSPAAGFVPIKNRTPGPSALPAAQMVSPDALALVRFGLRAPDDPRVVNTVRVIDALLKTETPFGPVWRRYNGDGYGEHADGSPFDGTGVGRGWPLLVGERAHYELAAGRRREAVRLLHALEALAGSGGLFPEQVWDAPDVPERELFFGRPSGSAMPLVWAHAEYLKLRRSLRDGRVFDQPVHRTPASQSGPSRSARAVWRFNQKCRTADVGSVLRVETLAPAVVHWSVDDWRSARDTAARDAGLGVYVADLDTAALPAGARVRFTFYWPDANRWEGTDFVVEFVKPPSRHDDGGYGAGERAPHRGVARPEP